MHLFKLVALFGMHIRLCCISIEHVGNEMKNIDTISNDNKDAFILSMLVCFTFEHLFSLEFYKSVVVVQKNSISLPV